MVGAGRRRVRDHADAISANPSMAAREDIDMRHIAIGGLSLALVVSGGCASTDQARLDPDTASTVAAPNPTLVPVPAGTTVVTPPSTAGAPAPGTAAVAPPADTTTLEPAPTTAVTPGLAAVVVTLRAEDIKSPRVRAQTIYANRIEAKEIRGVIHQDSGLKVRDANGALTGSEIVASVIYADEIKADIVIADNIYVRDIRRR